MTTTQPSVFDNGSEDLDPINRTQLLPWWIRQFNWLFLFGAVTVPFIIIQAISGVRDLNLSAYGLTTNDLLSPGGIILIFVFLFNGFTAYALLTERDWAIKVAIIDAFIGIAVCLYTMTVATIASGSFMSHFRYELIFLALFLRALMYLRADWDNTPA